ADALQEALEMAQAAAPEGGGAGRGLVLYTGAPEWHEHSPQVEALRERFDGIKIQLLTGGPLTLFAQQLPVASPINLLQGSYTPVTQGSVGWQAWRVAAILLGCLVGLHIVGKTAELGLLKRQEHTLDTSMSETFRRSMPGERYNAFDARRRMELRLAAAQNGIDSSGLLAALEALSQAKSVAPGAVVQALSFHQGALE